MIIPTIVILATCYLATCVVALMILGFNDDDEP